MSDDTSQRHGQDRTRIDVSQKHELRYWTEKFGVSEEELRNAVQVAGTQVEAVRRMLQKH